MCKVMGIVNVTPDSFSDGGMFFKPEEAIRRARNLVEEGADIVDIGGESTRPDAMPIGWAEEWGRLEPVVRELAKERVRSRCRLSVDTYHPETAARAIALGAEIINCVRSEFVPDMVQLLAGNEIELVMPAAALDRLVEPSSLGSRLYLDPMVGFGTTREEDVARLRSITELSRRGRVLVGASRKRIVKKLTGEKLTGKNLGGNIGIAVWAAMNGASVVRVHDVKETVQALRVIEQLKGECK